MDLLLENSPESCSNIGLDCGTCIHRSAASVAAICRGLEPAALQQIFFQLYPAPGCHPMAQAFALAYQESSVAQKPALAFASAAA
jgi:hypothetical protein